MIIYHDTTSLAEMLQSANVDHDGEFNPGSWAEYLDEHQDCLAAHDRAVKAEALREAAEDFTSPIDPTCYLTTEGRKFIRSRADQIEGAAE